jgi:hypothetical protein
MIPTQPKRGEVARWMLWLLVLAISGLCGTIAALYTSNRSELREKDAAIQAKEEQIALCLREQAEIQRQFRQELSAVFERANKALQEVERVKRRRRQ